MRFLKSLFFENLNASGVNYVVLRNYEKIVADLENDIDILIKERELPTFYQFMHKLLPGCAYKVLLFPDKLQVSAQLFDEHISLDIHTSLSYYGLPYAMSNRVLQHGRSNNKGIWLLDDQYSALISVLNRALHNRPILDSDFVLLEQIPSHIRERQFAEILGSDIGCIVALAIGEGKDKFAALARSKIIWALRQKKWNAVFTEISYRTLRHWRKALEPRGGLLVLLGTHGAGKSTTAEFIKRQASKAGLNVMSLHVTSRPGILPALTSRSEHAAHSSKRLREKFLPLIHSLRTCYHVFDYWILWLRCNLKSSRSIIVLDRYIYDYAVEPRNTHATPPLVRTLLLRLAPTPGLTAILWESPEIIHQRKAELSVAKIKEETERYLSFLKFPNALAYRVNTSSEEIAYSIFKDFLIANGSLPKIKQ